MGISDEFSHFPSHSMILNTAIVQHGNRPDGFGLFGVIGTPICLGMSQIEVVTFMRFMMTRQITLDDHPSSLFCSDSWQYFPLLLPSTTHLQMPFLYTDPYGILTWLWKITMFNSV